MTKRAIVGLSLLLGALAAPAEAEDRAITVTSYSVTIENAGADGALSGRIILRNGAAEAGQIDLGLKAPQAPRLSDDKSSVFMSAPWERLQDILAVLNAGTPLQIRYTDTANANGQPVAAIESLPRPTSVAVPKAGPAPAATRQKAPNQ